MSGTPPDRAMLIRLIHAALFTGTVLIGVVLFIARARATPAPIGNTTLGLALAGAAVLAIVIAVTQLRARVAPRGSDQSPGDFWSDQRTNAAAMLLWAVLEGAALLSIVGFYLSGSAIPIGVAVVAVVIGIVLRPATLEG